MKAALYGSNLSFIFKNLDTEVIVRVFVIP